MIGQRTDFRFKRANQKARYLGLVEVRRGYCQSKQRTVQWDSQHTVNKSSLSWVMFSMGRFLISKQEKEQGQKRQERGRWQVCLPHACRAVCLSVICCSWETGLSVQSFGWTCCVRGTKVSFRTAQKKVVDNSTKKSGLIFPPVSCFGKIDLCWVLSIGLSINMHNSCGWRKNSQGYCLDGAVLRSIAIFGDLVSE